MGLAISIIEEAISKFQPSESYEITLVSEKIKTKDLIRKKIQTRNHSNLDDLYEKALRSFESNGFLLFVNDKQITDLEEDLFLTPNTVIRFLKLIPMVGG